MLLSSIPAYFKARRDRLAQAHPNAVFVFPSSHEVIRNNDVHHPFRQDSNFYYLSGFDEPESFLVMTPSKTPGSKHRMVLFVRKRDAEKEMWEGERYGTDGAQKVFGADEAYTNDEFDAKLPELLAAGEKVFYRIGTDEAIDRRVMGAMETHRRSLGRSGRALPPIADPSEAVGEMRIFKSREEVDLLRRACSITGEGHKTLMKEVRPGMNEFEVEALIDYAFRRNGCQRLGYGSIVAGGKNATCLHYRSNNEVLKDGSLLLVDAGGEYGYYTSDITRTFPIGKRFSEAQAKVYDLVLKTQKEAVAACKPGATLPAIHKQVCLTLIDGMLSLGLLKGNPEEILTTNGHKRFYPHNTSHWLGMDVHDAGLYMKNGEPRRLEPGMVFTIEPGFYVQPSDTAVPPEYRDIGIRIEDDILITENGNENLTISAPKERAEIESLRN